LEYTQLGRTGLKVSRLCLGTMNFGPKTTDEDSFAIMDRAHEHGINFFDTANVYGWKMGEGITEKIVGNWFAQGGGRREKTVLATKLYGKMADWPNFNGLSALNIRRACDESLTRMKTDYIDLYQFHHIDRNAPWDEIWQACETLVQQGKVLYIGSSNFPGWGIAHANEVAKSRHFLGLVSEQSLYNLNGRTIELEVIPACEKYGLGLIPWSPLGGGLLAGVLEGFDKEGRRGSDPMKEGIEEHRAKLEPWEALCKELGQRPSDVALAWLLTRKAVTAPIVGPRTVQQLDEAVAAMDIVLTEETLDRLDDIFPGFKTAPEHYAW